MTLTPQATTIIVAVFLVFILSAGVMVAAALLSRLLALILSQFGVEVD